MNSQLSPIDPVLRENLARRSSGRMPEGLATQVLQAVDRAPVKPRYAWRAFSPRPARSIPRRLLAGAGLTAVVLLAAAFVVVPRFQTTPASGLAGYPADRALSTAELAALMAGPALPVNTALVASVTIESRPDVCPMDSRPTIGVVQGMGSQVCVIGSTVSAYQQAEGMGTFAFRYMAPGILGLLGEITPASSAKVAFRVAEDWPLQGKTFLVDGWLGAVDLMVSCASAPTSGDVLLPNGEDCPFDDWLGDDSTGPGIQADHVSMLGSPLSSNDPLSPRGNARYVGAGGTRLIDSLDPTVPIHGVFVVRSATEACPGGSPISSRGCPAWRVLARVAEGLATARETASPSGSSTEGPETPIPESTPSPTPATPPTGYPADRALTAAELAAVMAGPALAVDTTLIAAVTIDSSESGAPGCVPTGNYTTIGLVHGMPTRICVFGGGFSPARVPGIFALRYLGPGALYLLAEITPASSSQPVFHATESWPWTISGDATFLVGGYLVREPAGSRIADTPNGPAPSTNTYQTVQVDAAAGIDSTDPSRYGVFVVWCVPVYTPSDSMGSHGDGFAYHVIARVADISVPGGASPTPAPPATPRALPTGSPDAADDTQPLGVMGSDNRPLTVAELPQLWAADPAHLAGRIVIAKGPVPTGFECSGVGAADASAPPGACHITVLDGQIAPEGYWAILVGADGKLTIVGELSTPGSKFTISTEEARALWSTPGSDKALVLVDAWIGGMGADACDVAGQPCYEVSWLAPSADKVSWVGSSPADGQVSVQPGAYHMFGAGKVGGGPAIQGIFLVQGLGEQGQVLARMEPVTP